MTLADGQLGTWYGECDGIYTVREFVVYSDNRLAVAPFDVPFRGPGHPTAPPALAGIAPISLHMFESLWEQFAQPRLHEISVARSAADTVASTKYFRTPFPAAFKLAEGASDIYAEYAAGVARRSFEVFAGRTLVAPFDVGIPEYDAAEMLRAAREALAPDGESIDPLLRHREISHAVFEALWEQHALPRLRALTELSFGTPDS